MAGDSNEKQSKENLTRYPLLTALMGRRSRRFGRGMQIEDGPFTYKSAHAPQPLSEEEELALVFAAGGVTGYALADLAYGVGQGGSMLAGLVGRTIAATVAYCEYVYKRYGTFPVFSAPYRTAIGYQATHVDVEFYDRFFKPEALTSVQRQHQAGWHGN